MKKLIMILSVFILLFTISAILITNTLIKKQRDEVKSYHLDSNETPLLSSQTDINIPTPKIGLKTYDPINENDIIFEKEIIEYHGAKLEVPKIKGLKNKTIENRVNTSILEKIKKSTEKDDWITIGKYHICASASNVISIQYFYYSDDFEYEPYDWATHVKVEGLNFELVNGKEITLEDLFIENIGLTGVIKEAIYHGMLSIFSYYYDKNLTSAVEKKPNQSYESNGYFIYNYDENFLYEKVKDFVRHPNFTFNCNEIELLTSEEAIWESSDSMYPDLIYCIGRIYLNEECVILNKYAPYTDLYENDTIGIKNYYRDSSYFHEESQLADNLSYCVYIRSIHSRYFSFEDINQEERIQTQSEYEKTISFKNDFLKVANDQKQSFLELAQENPDDNFSIDCSLQNYTYFDHFIVLRILFFNNSRLFKSVSLYVNRDTNETFYDTEIDIHSLFRAESYNIIFQKVQEFFRYNSLTEEQLQNIMQTAIYTFYEQELRVQFTGEYEKQYIDIDYFYFGNNIEISYQQIDHK